MLFTEYNLEFKMINLISVALKQIFGWKIDYLNTEIRSYSLLYKTHLEPQKKNYFYFFDNHKFQCILIEFCLIGDSEMKNNVCLYVFTLFYESGMYMISAPYNPINLKNTEAALVLKGFLVNMH